MRVGKAGYIETPESWFEKMCPFTYHRLEITAIEDKLYIRKKPCWKPEEIATIWDVKLSKSKELSDFLRINPDLNHLRYYWKDSIDYKIINPDCDASWPYPEEALRKNTHKNPLFISIIREIYLFARRYVLSQNNRNKKLDIFGLIRCPTCHCEKFEIYANTLKCLNCNSSYNVVDNIPRLYPKNVDGFNELRI